MLVILLGMFFPRAATAETAFTNEFWISPVATGTNGIGTLDDPFDGSTEATFDFVMSNLPPNCTIHLLAGKYQTLGSDNGFSLKTGQKLLGSGVDNTTLQLVPNAPGSSFVYVVYGCDVSNNVVADLTVDCNVGSETMSSEGVELCGTRNTVRNVKVINSGDTGTVEAWGIAVNYTGSYPSEGNLIENCQVGPNQGSVSLDDGIGFGATMPNTTYGISGVIRNNRIYGAFLAINMSWAQNCLIEGNYIERAGVGVYSDTGGITNIIIANNRFVNCVNAVCYRNSYQRQNITIAFNSIQLTNVNPNAFNFSLDTSITNLAIIGNTVSFACQPATGGFFLTAYNITGLVVANNSVDAALTNQITSCTNVSVYNNYDLNGSFLTSLNQVAPPNGVTRTTEYGTNSFTYYAKYSDNYIGMHGIWQNAGPQETVYTNLVVLPPALGQTGKEFIISDEGGALGSHGSGGLMILGIIPTATDRINASSSVTFTDKFSSRTVISDGTTNWFAH